MRKKILLVALVGALSLGASACSSNTESVDTTLPAETTFTVDGAWARTSPMESTVGAAYMNITASADDALVGA
jgi:copper(I)-binding protein